MRRCCVALGIAALAAMAQPASAQCVQTNGGFETGDFTGWTQWGDTSFASVGGMPHSGAFAAAFGPPMPGGIQQTQPLAAGATVIIEYWLFNGATGVNSFAARFDGVTLNSLVNSPALPYTQFSHLAVVSAANPLLQFEFTQVPAFWWIDDITVCATTTCCDPATGTCSAAPATGCVAPLVAGPAGVMTCAPNPCTVACCDTTTGACSQSFTAACAAPLVAAPGAATSCTPDPCPKPLACCDNTTGACRVVPPGVAGATCGPTETAGPGNPVTCMPDPCPKPFACCDNMSGICQVFPPVAIGCGPGTFAPPVPSQTCAPDPCPKPFACCDNLSGICQVLPPIAPGCPPNTFPSPLPSQTCVPDPCPKATACCDTVTGACQVAPAIAVGVCPMGSITPPFMTVSCIPDPCPKPLACCNTFTGACTVSPPAFPFAACLPPTVPAPGMPQTCVPDVCPKPLACCDTTTGACTVQPPGGPAGTMCSAPTVPAMGAPQTCMPDPCPKPLACCDNITGTCRLVPPGVLGASCLPSEFASPGNAQTCTPDPCPKPFACCDNVTGNCQLVAPVNVTCPAGSFGAPGGALACIPDPCPKPVACCNQITGACSQAPPPFTCLPGTVAAPGNPATCTPFPCPAPGSAVLGLGCLDCTFVNGPFDGRDGQVSHLGGAVPNGAKAADDFALCDGFLYQVRSISATILTTTFPGLVKPQAQIWSDCNGCPYELIATLDVAFQVETGLVFPNPAPDGRPLRIIYATWFPPAQTDIASRLIALKGGVYWLSVFGLSDNLGPTMGMYDITYWGTTGGEIKGTPASKIDGIPTGVFNTYLFLTGPTGACPAPGTAPGPFQWTSLADCCIGCTDLNFTFCADECKVLVNNGEARLPTLAAPIVGSTSQFAPVGPPTALETRSADDFFVQPCQNYRLCYAEGCILTNCPFPGFEGVMEIYENDCNKPDYCLAINGAGCGVPAFGPLVANKIVPLGYTAVMDGQVVTAYRIEFHHINGVVLQQGRQYWVSFGVRYNFNAAQRGYFCFNADCRRSCPIRWNEGMVLTRNTLDHDAVVRTGCNSPTICNGWARTGNDFAFLLAADGVTLVGPINSVPSCGADFNRDGALDAQDIFDYINGWFGGCP